MTTLNIMVKGGLPCITIWNPLKGWGVVSSGLGHHGDPSPVRPEDPYCPGGHALSFQYVQAPVPVQGIISLMEVQ